MRPVAITGTGAVTPIGASTEAFVEGWHAGDLGVRPAPWTAAAPTPCLFAGVTDRFDPTTTLDERLIDGTDRFVSFGLVASDEAVRRAGFTNGAAALDPTRTAVVDGTSMGGFYSLMAAQAAFEAGGPAAIPPKTMLKIWTNMTAAQISIRHRLHGPQQTVTTACASSLDAIGLGAALIAAGSVDVAICGGTEGGAPATDDGSGFVPVTSVAGRMLGMESPEVDPSRAVLPFDRHRSGIVFGEGAAWFVLESADHVERRGAAPLAWLLGYGSCADAHHPSSPDPSGRWEAHAMSLAQASAGLGPADIDVVLAHATATPKGDLAEIRAIAEVFSPATRGRGPVVTALKGHTGHTGAASGAMSALAAVDVLRSGRLEPVRGTDDPDPAVDFDLALTTTRHLDAEVAQVNAFGFGGQNASIVLGAPT